MWAKSPYYVNPSPSLSRNPSVDVPSRAASVMSSRQPSIDSQLQSPPSPSPLQQLQPPPSPSPAHLQQLQQAQQFQVPHLQSPPTSPFPPPSPAPLPPPPSIPKRSVQFHEQMHAPIVRMKKPAIVIDVEALATESPMETPIGFFSSPMASKRNSAVVMEEIMKTRALARVKRQTTREARFSFTETPSTSVEITQTASRPRFHSIAHNTEFAIVQHRISAPPEPVNIVPIEPKVTRKPTSYYEVYPLEGYDNKTERKKNKHYAKTDPHYQASLRDEIEIRKYTLIAVGICIFIALTVGSFTIWQLVMDFTNNF